MAALFPRLTAIACVLVLAACEMALPTGGGKSAATNPITGGDIEVTALDAVPPGKPDGATPKDAKDTAAKTETAPLPADPGPKLRPKPRPEDLAGKGTKVDEIAAPEPAPAKPESEKSEAQIACEKQGNTWARAGDSPAHSCVTYTKDGGNQCTKGTQCEGECLARSGTCAPFKPLFGCNDILQDDGSRVTLCID